MVLIISRNSACVARKYVVAKLPVGKIYQIKGKKYTKGLLLLTYLNWMPSIVLSNHSMDRAINLSFRRSHQVILQEWFMKYSEKNEEIKRQLF